MHINFLFFFFTNTTTTEIYTLSLHDALPICKNHRQRARRSGQTAQAAISDPEPDADFGRGVSVFARPPQTPGIDRKSTRLNSSHPSISYAVFCLKKKIKQIIYLIVRNTIYDR